MVYIKIDAEGRLTAVAGHGFHCGEGEIAIGLPDDFAPPARDWVLKDGVLVHDPLPKEEAPVDQMEVLKQENTILKAQVQALSDRGEFIEDCIAEMATVVYGG